MTRTIRWGVAALVLCVPLGFVIPVLAERGTDQDSPGVKDAKTMVALIDQGQLNLVDATKLAEKHVSGTALRADCTVQPLKDKTQHRLVYAITCLAKDKSEVQAVQIDGRTKQVIGSDKAPRP